MKDEQDLPAHRQALRAAGCKRGESHSVWCEGKSDEYEADKRRGRGADATVSDDIKSKALNMA